MSVITTLIATIVASPIFASAPVQAVIAALGLGGATVAGQVLALGLIGALGIFALALGSYMLVNNKGMGLWNSPSEKDDGSVSEEEQENEDPENRDDTSSSPRASCSNSSIDPCTSSEEETSDSVRVQLFPETPCGKEYWERTSKMRLSSKYEYCVVRRRKVN